jgi:vacuolar iron transporter family protein
MTLRKRENTSVVMQQIEEKHPHGGDWLREIVFGLNDGLVTTLVFLMAVSSTEMAHLLVIVLGEVMAGGISMALGGFLAARTEQEVRDHQIDIERYEVKNEPDEERAELRSIYERKGFQGPLLDRVITHLTANEDRWHMAMVHDELGIVEDTRINPWLRGIQIGLSFVMGGLIPSLPLIFRLPYQQWWAYGLTAITALSLGAIKARYTNKGPLRAGIEFLIVVTIGTLAGVALGFLLHTA